MSNILITSIGRRVSLIKAFQIELNTLMPNCLIYVADAKPKLSAACKIAEHYFKVPRLDNPSYIDKLIQKCKSNNIGLIIPTIDTELLLLADNKEKLLSHNIQPVISSIDFIKKCRDKRLIHTFFKQRNIATAIEYSKNDYEFPLFIKPVDGSRSVDNFVIKSENDFIDSHFENNNLMFLEYLDHNIYEEYTCDIYYGRDSELKCIVPRKRIEVRDGEVNKGKTEKNILVNFIKKKLSFIEGARGCLTAQFFKNKESNDIYGIEINPRFGGGYPLSYEARANFPKWIIEEYLFNKTIKYFNDWEDNLLMLRYDKEVLVKNSDA